MNRQKHKLSRRILAVLLMAAMLITMLPSAIFAAPSDHRPGGADSTQPENAVSIDKTAERVGPDPDTWNVTMTVEASKEIQSEPLELVLLLDRSGSMAWCTHSEHEYAHYDKGGSWCGGYYRWEQSDRDSRQAIAGNAAKDLIDDLAGKGISASVSVVGFADDEMGKGSNTEVLQSMTALTKTSAGQIKGEIPTSGAYGGTYMNTGLKLANQQFSDGATNKVIIMLADGDFDGTNPNGNKGYVSTLKRNNVTVHTIGFTTENNTLEKIADTTGGNYYTANDADQLANVFTQIAGNLTAMVEDDMGDDVEIVAGSAEASNGTVSVSRDGKLSWNPKDGKLDAGKSATITYTVKLTDEKKAALQVGDNTVNLNGDTVLTYQLNGQGETYILDFPRPTDNVEYAKLSVSNEVNGEPAKEADDYPDQYAIAYDGNFYQKNEQSGSFEVNGFDWVAPDDQADGANYSGSSKLIVPDAKNAIEVTSENFSQKLTLVTGGEYKLVHEYNSVQEGSLTVQIYVDGEAESVNSDEDLNKYIQDLTNAGETNSVELTYNNDGKVTVSYDYEKYNSADLNFKVANGLVLQAVNGEFIVGQNYWKGVVSEINGTMTVDNVKGDPDSTLEIYLNTPYTVEYYGTETAITDENTYIVSEQEVTAPNFPTDLDSLGSADRSKGYPGGWADTSLKTEVELEKVPADYTGWYKTDNGNEKHAEKYTGTEIKNAAENNNDSTPTVIECYAQEVKPAITGIEKEVVTEKVEGIDGTYQYPTVDENGNPLLTVNKGDDVTLLYKITVTGDEGAGFKVTDTNAQYVGTTTDGVEIGTEDGITGTIPAGGEVVLYVSMTHENVTGETPLKNSATVENTGDGEDPENPTVEEEVPVVVNPGLDSIAKEVVTEKVEGIDGTYQYPTVDENGNPLLTVNKGDDVTLLYKITVTGDEGAGFKVTDTNAQYVGTTTDGVEIGTEDGITGTIPAGGEVVLYVSMTHENVTGETPLKNSATVENTGDGKDPENPTVEEEVPVELEETFTLIYDANGGTIGSTNTAEKTNLNADSYNLWQWTENADGTIASTGILPDGVDENTSDVPKHDNAPAPEDTIISDAGESVPVIFIGWSKTKPEKKFMLPEKILVRLHLR